MKIQCEFCNKKEAIVFCCADEAALCHGCDQRVHHANKLASKHHRFSLLQAPLAPLCDICQEKRALLFCQEDRAILCRDCEKPLHADEHTQKHNRFLLTGIKLCDLGVSGCLDPVHDFESLTKPISQISSSDPTVVTNSNSTITVDSVTDQLVSGGSSSNVSVSDHFIDLLPGWHFEDFQDPSFAFNKSGSMNELEVDEDVLSFWEVDIDKKMSFSYSNQSENLGIWVPQAPAAAAVKTPFFTASNNNNYNYNYNQPSIIQSPSVLSGAQGFKVLNKKWSNNDAFTVPQITHSLAFKRPRPW